MMAGKRWAATIAAASLLAACALSPETRRPASPRTVSPSADVAQILDRIKRDAVALRGIVTQDTRAGIDVPKQDRLGGSGLYSDNTVEDAILIEAELGVEFQHIDGLALRDELVDLMTVNGLTESTLDLKVEDSGTEIHTFPGDPVTCDMYLSHTFGQLTCVTTVRLTHFTREVAPGVVQAAQKALDRPSFDWYWLHILENEHDPAILGAYLEVDDGGDDAYDTYLVNLTGRWELVFEDDLSSDVEDQKSDALCKPEYRDIFKDYAYC